MFLSMIAAMGRNRVIGKKNDIPWKLPAEQQYFKEVTMGHAVVSGRKNFESMGRPLKGRRNIIITRNRDYRPDNCEIIYTIEELYRMFDDSDEEVFIIGGEEIYRMFLPFSKKLYITSIDAEFDGDTYFPLFSETEWTQISEKNGLTDEKNPYHYTFKVFERKLT